MAIVHNSCSVKARPIVMGSLQLNVTPALQVEQVGQGTFGTVIQAAQLGKDSLPDVAIKLLPRGALVSCHLHRSKSGLHHATMASALKQALCMSKCTSAKLYKCRNTFAAFVPLLLQMHVLAFASSAKCVHC